MEVVDEVLDGEDAPGPISGWKDGGRFILFLYGPEYLGGSLRDGGAILSHSLELVKELGSPRPLGLFAQLVAVLTKSGEYILTFLRTVATRVVLAPFLGDGLSCLWVDRDGSIVG
jgi:hypothetical protein